MEYEEIKEWLDKLVINLKEAQELEYFNEQINTCVMNRQVQIYKGIDIIADVMGIELNIEEDMGCVYPFSYSFMHDGVIFFQLAEERFGKHVPV